MTNTNKKEEGQTLYSDTGKKARIFVIDYGEHMFSEDEWRFRMALKIVRNQINKLCCTGDPNELCSIIFVNTSNSNTIQKVDCIFTDRELGLIDADYVKKLDKLINSNKIKEMLIPTLGDSGECNWADLFLLCQNIFTNTTRVFPKKVITIFTTDKAQIDKDVQECCNTRIYQDIKFIGTEIKVLLIEEKIEENETTQFWKNLDPYFSRISSLEDVDKFFFYFKDYTLRPSTTLLFDLGYDLKFAVGLYHLIKPQVKPLPVLMDSLANEKVEYKSHYKPENVEKKETDLMELTVDEVNNLNKTQEHLIDEHFEGEINFNLDVGGVNVILNREEKESLRKFDKPGITVIGFKPLHLLKPSHRMGPSKFIYPNDKVISGSSSLYRGLLNRCLERKLFIVVRFTQTTNTTPKLCALVPQAITEENEGNNSLIGHIYEGFHLIELPFADGSRDLRSANCYKPPPTSSINSSENIKEQRIAAAEDFIDKLTTTFEPDQFFNPMLQRHYKTVENAALDLNFDNFAEEAEKLDKIQPYFKNEENAERVKNEIIKLNELCIGGNLNLIKEEDEEKKILLKKERKK
ncbi:Ku domain-containing protein [Meloidogyne graminicola]|uniref:Ku domain-containing protein n=1 Tax=Meloidogyne graminicola TaxID=189291 RepID=A0A8S9ZT32_9BILA|nr:Ku domain-containing protein [Meloidogyne graminicola]